MTTVFPGVGHEPRVLIAFPSSPAMMARGVTRPHRPVGPGVGDSARVGATERVGYVKAVIGLLFVFVGLGLVSHKLGRWTYALMLVAILAYVVYADSVPPSLATAAL